MRAAAADWEDRGRSDAALPTASATADYVRWRDDDNDNGTNTHLARSELRFLAAAESHHEALARRDRSRIRVLTSLAGALAVVTVVALIASFFALRATSDARETRDAAPPRPADCWRWASRAPCGCGNSTPTEW